MSKTLLEEMERHERHRLRLRVRELGAISPVKSMLASFLVAPFAWVCLLFIPFVGLLLVLLAIAITLRYLFLIRSPKLTAMVTLGSVGSTVAASIFFTAFFERSDYVFYFMAGFSVAIVTAYIIAMASYLWLHYERAATEER